MQKITNVKTSKTEKMEKDFITSLKARKRHFLQNTDWTQVNDVHIENDVEIRKWRQELREFKIGDQPDENVERQLNGIISRKPEIKASTKKYIEVSQSDEEHLETMVPNTDPESWTNGPDEYESFSIETGTLCESECRDKLKECFQQYKSNELIQKGSVFEYNLKKIMLEEAVDRKLSNGKSSTPLLDQDSFEHTEDELDEIINDCKSYFKNLNQLYTRLNKEERSLYNMDTNEINQWFESHGYRYRCKN